MMVRPYKLRFSCYLNIFLILVSKVDHSNNDCLLVAVMTHGKDGGEIFSADQCYHIQELWKNFVGSKCESLVGKPKLFFIQACRGPMNYSGALQTGRKTNEEDAESENDILIPNSDDFMIMYPASKGHKSYRNILQGSWFIQTLCNELIINSQYDLIQILLRVKRKVAVYSRTEKLSLFNRIFKKQMPSIESRLTKLVYFSQSSMNYKTAFKIDPYQQQIIPFKVANIMVD